VQALKHPAASTGMRPAVMAEPAAEAETAETEGNMTGGMTETDPETGRSMNVTGTGSGHAAGHGSAPSPRVRAARRGEEHLRAAASEGVAGTSHHLAPQARHPLHHPHPRRWPLLTWCA